MNTLNNATHTEAPARFTVPWLLEALGWQEYNNDISDEQKALALLFRASQHRLLRWTEKLYTASSRHRIAVVPSTSHFADMWLEFNAQYAALCHEDQLLLWLNVAGERTIEWSLKLEELHPDREHLAWVCFDICKNICRDHFNIGGVEWIRSPESALCASAQIIDVFMTVAAKADPALAHP